MSAYVCSSLHIAWLARFIVATTPNARHETVLTAMIDANLASVGFRYSHLSEKEADYGLPGIPETTATGARFRSRNAAIAAFRAEVATAYARFAAQVDGFVPTTPDASNAALRAWWLKQFDCYAYQSCEHLQWDSSRAKGFVDQAIRLLFPNDQERIEAARSAAYDRAPWGIDDWNEWSPGNDPILRSFTCQQAVAA